ncbi:hypothetical protein OG897_06935 [Streptomyces sp. NBC_00237]|uniref:hypothetical protein n=1 Tax=Streptomyces sp. NBC_00237 TaxID=2975687 RepID=UPI0022542277|nr:hypothetical protein [Streptomyces sp. NBC_00237]MCX5201194.1 hypothetical protein [Streptomyces sp. NBC_00237]
MAASAQLLLSALSPQVSGPDSVLDGTCACGCGAEPPLTSEPPLADAAPLTSEPPLTDATPLTSEPTSYGTASGTEYQYPGV